MSQVFLWQEFFVVVFVNVLIIVLSILLKKDSI